MKISEDTKKAVLGIGAEYSSTDWKDRTLEHFLHNLFGIRPALNKILDDRAFSDSEKDSWTSSIVLEDSSRYSVKTIHLSFL